MSKTLIDASYSFLYQMFRYDGEGDELSDTEIDEIKAAVDLMMREVEQPMLIGAILPYAGNDPPMGTLPCNGAEYSRQNYPLLYDYLVGSSRIVDEDLFVTPYFPGRAVTMVDEDHDPYNLYGDAEITLTEDHIPPHSHSYTPPSFDVDLETPGAPDIFAASVGAPSLTGSTGGGEAHSNIPPSIALNWCIVAGSYITPEEEPPLEGEFILYGTGAVTGGETPSGDSEVWVGVKFSVTDAGSITHGRFWKNAGDGDTHIFGVWDDANTLVDTFTFDSETASGWQEIEIDPIHMDAGEEFTIAVLHPVGYYTKTFHYFDADYDVDVFHVEGGGMNGLYGYTSTSGEIVRPTNVYQNTNYFVSVRFLVDA